MTKKAIEFTPYLLRVRHTMNVAAIVYNKIELAQILSQNRWRFEVTTNSAYSGAKYLRAGWLYE